MKRTLTDTAVRNLKPRGERFEVRDGGGLALWVYPSGVRSWVYTYVIDGRKVRWAFGEYPTLSLRDARERHGSYRDLVKAGIDPKEYEKAQREEEARRLEDEARRRRLEEQSTTTRELVAEYVKKWAKPRKRSWKEDERQLEKDVVPAWGDLKAKDITRREVRLLIEAKAEVAPIAANRLLACVRRMFNWAVEQDILENSPATRIKAPAKENRKQRVLSPEEIRAFWTATEGATEEIRRALKLILVTAQRPGEVIGARWEEFDLEDGWWTIPGERAKNGQAHRVPLSSVALELLGKPGKGYVFPSPAAPGKEPAPMNPSALARATWRHAVMEPRPIKSKSRGIRKRHKPPVAWKVEPFTPHDLRRTAASLMTGTGISRLVVAKLLNHVERGVTAIYDRHSYDLEKREALNRWGAHLSKIVAGETGMVVPLHRRRA